MTFLFMLIIKSKLMKVKVSCSGMTSDYLSAVCSIIGSLCPIMRLEVKAWSHY